MGIIDQSQAAALAEREPEAMADADPAELLAKRLGIPAHEFTPRVRMAIAALMGEVERLKRESDATRKKLLDTERAANQDMLLPVLNRRAFVREITRFAAFAERYGTPAVLIYFDLDGFKSVNDVHGHAAGDAALHHFADLLISQVRGTDVVGRLGGDEFGIVLAHATLEQAQTKAEILRSALRGNQPRWQGKAISLSFSYGAYELRVGESADTALANADHAMYASKRAR